MTEQPTPEGDAAGAAVRIRARSYLNVELLLLASPSYSSAGPPSSSRTMASPRGPRS